MLYFVFYDLSFWHENKTFNAIEISARLHHRAVVIHPFLNGNGRWSRMLDHHYQPVLRLVYNHLYGYFPEQVSLHSILYGFNSFCFK
jgi:hypothetical protein